MLFGENSGDWIQRIDYGMLLPFMAKLPLSLGEKLAKMRGVIHAITDYDWRSMALRHNYVRTRTYQAMQMLLPQANMFELAFKTAKRFIHNSREEWQGAVFGQQHLMFEIARRSHADGLDELLEIQKQKRGMILMTAHYDSFAMGIALLGMYGLTINGLSSNVVENPRVHPAVRDFFYKKYRNLENYTRGGKIAHYENNMRFFYHALERGETVVILGDIPGDSRAVPMSFLGKTFKMPLGAWSMAKKTGSLIGAFICSHEKPGTYRIACLSPKEIHPENPVETMLPAYRFLETRIRQAPERWVAAELLPSYEA
jgi:lauroyl/myristoyl acyltransferase